MHFNPFLVDLLSSVPSLLLDVPLTLVDGFLRSLGLTALGPDLALVHPLRAIRPSWFVQLLLGGSIGMSGAFLISVLNLWGPSWEFSSKGLHELVWELWAPWVLTLLYMVLRGSSPDVNTLSSLLTARHWGEKRTLFLTEEEARAVIAVIYISALFLRRFGIWSGSLGPLYSGTAARRAVVAKKIQ